MQVIVLHILWVYAVFTKYCCKEVRGVYLNVDGAMACDWMQQLALNFP